MVNRKLLIGWSSLLNILLLVNTGSTHLVQPSGIMWVLEKIRDSVETNVLRQGEAGDKGKAPVYSNVLTPNKIPDFFIPPKLVSCPPETEASDVNSKESLRPSTSEQTINNQKISSPRSPRLVSKLAGDTKNLLRAANRHIIQIESADEVVAGDTNADPQSQTAMSLPYIPKTHTSYGFATLMESPHTRRKESLFPLRPHQSSYVTQYPTQVPRQEQQRGESPQPSGLQHLSHKPLPILQWWRERHLLFGRVVPIQFAIALPFRLFTEDLYPRDTGQGRQRQADICQT